MSIKIKASEIELLHPNLQSAWETIKTKFALKKMSNTFLLEEEELEVIRAVPGTRKGLRLILKAVGAQRARAKVETAESLRSDKITASRQKRADAKESRQAEIDAKAEAEEESSLEDVVEEVVEEVVDPPS
jgi:hypothetical protein